MQYFKMAVFSIILLLALLPLVSAWANESYGYISNCTVNTTVASSLVDFPVRCVMNTATPIAAYRGLSDCTDFVPYDNDDTTMLSRVIENCNNETFTLLTSIPTLKISLMASDGNQL